MSTFEAPLMPFTLEEHPNADSLSIAKIGGWQCVVRTDDFKDETFAIYLPLDAIAAIDHPLLGFMAGKRVKICKLRGVVSEGVMLPFESVKEYMRTSLGMKEESIDKVSREGRDFAGILRVKRWIDPTVRMISGDAESAHPKFHKYTSIEHLKKYTSVINIGEEVHITEKLHGTSARYAYIDGKFLLGSRGRQLKNEEDQKSVWHFAYRKHNLDEKLLQLYEMFDNQDVAIYGEIVGPKVQDLCYGQLEPAFFVYDITVKGMYLNARECYSTAKKLGLDSVPLIKIGSFEERDLLHRTGNSLLDDSHVREGIVIKPTTERWDPAIGRVTLKVISEDYLLRNNPVDIRE
jgi:RNA ligase (TIGR02306 family)